MRDSVSFVGILVLKRIASGACVFLAFFLIFICQSQGDESTDYIHFRLGEKYQHDQKFDQALEEYRKVLTIYPDHYKTYLNMAQIRQDQKQYRLAIYNLKKALLYNPGWSVATKKLAANYELDNQYASALKEWQDYFQICDPAERDSIQQQINRVLKTMTSHSSLTQDDNQPGADSSSITPKKQSNSRLVTESVQTSAAVPQPPPPPPPPAVATDTGAGQLKRPRSRGDDTVSISQLFDRAAAAYGQAVASGEEQLYKEALEQHLRVLKRQSGHSGANFYAGMIYRKLGDTARAKTHLIKGTRFGILGNDANFYLGKIFGSEQKYKEAIAYLSKYSEKTEYEPGRLEAKKLIDEYATNLRARLGDTVKIDLKALGQADMQKEISTISPVPKYAPVEVVIDSFLSLSLVDTFSKPGQEMLAAAEAFRQQQYDQAINGMRTVASRYPHDDVAVRCLYNMGICHFYLKNYPDAQRIFQQLLEKHPSHSLAAASLFLAATTCLQRHEPQQAEKLYRLFLMNHRNHRWTAAAYERLGDAYADLMDYKKAVDSYSACVKLSENPVVLMKLADAYNTLNNGSRAVEYYKKALAAGRAAPHLEIMPVVTYKLADCLYRQKNYPQALATYQNAVKQFPAYQDTPWGLFQAASIHKNLGAYDKAAEMFTLLIQKFPQDYWAQQARWKLEDTVWEHEYKSVFNKGQVTY